jgi:hypothetical protein
MNHRPHRRHHPEARAVTLSGTSPAPGRRAILETPSALREFSSLLCIFAVTFGATYLLLWKPMLQLLGM